MEATGIRTKSQKSRAIELRFIVLFLLVFATLNGMSQTKVFIQVLDMRGIPVSGVTVSYDDQEARMCVDKTTNAMGLVVIEASRLPRLILLHDTRDNPRYGFTSFHIKDSRLKHTVIIPFKPESINDLAKQLDQTYANIRQAYGIYSTLDMAYRVSSGARLAAGSTGLGVPGIFSVSPLPALDSRGRLTLEVSGKLADYIVHAMLRMQATIMGREVNYYFGAV